MAATEAAYTERHASACIREALDHMRIVAIVGPRQSGKTTLARQFADEDKRDYITLDNARSRAFAIEDPIGFMRDLDTAVIDEIQYAPDLMLALKKTVDEDTRPGRFLITGSVDLFKGGFSQDSLAGRVATIELLPFSQSEIEKRPPSAFIERAFEADFPGNKDAGHTEKLAERVVKGGYPEVFSKADPARQRAWLRAYASALTEHDLPEIAPVVKTDQMARLLDHASAMAGQLLNRSSLATPLGVDGKTIDRWIDLLGHMFVLRRTHAWYRNKSKRLIKETKIQFLDPGLLAALQRASAEELETRKKPFGPLLETFVYSELAKAAALDEEQILIDHYRDKDKLEVDFVLERAGRIVGIEVKASATATPADFRGLKRLQKIAGKDFVCGILLHDGERIHQAGKMYAMPVKMLWES